MTSYFKLCRVQYLPVTLEPGLLYLSEEYLVAGHLCPCGCGNKVITPIGPVEWSYSEDRGMPSLSPSIGNWELPCRSHYWIRAGKVEWSYQWSDKQVAFGRKKEEERRMEYFQKRKQRRKALSVIKRLLEKVIRIRK